MPWVRKLICLWAALSFVFATASLFGEWQSKQVLNQLMSFGLG